MPFMVWLGRAAEIGGEEVGWRGAGLNYAVYPPPGGLKIVVTERLTVGGQASSTLN
jgi:hypothetical protein